MGIKKVNKKYRYKKPKKVKDDIDLVPIVHRGLIIISVFALIVMITLIYQLHGDINILNDSKKDIETCEAMAQGILINEDYTIVQSLRCYANDDFDIINRGKNIRCSCYANYGQDENGGFIMSPIYSKYSGDFLVK